MASRYHHFELGVSLPGTHQPDPPRPEQFGARFLKTSFERLDAAEIPDNPLEKQPLGFAAQAR